jgi:hypothetical protein
MGSQPNGPATPVDTMVDYYKFDYEFAEPPRVTSLQNVVPLSTFSHFGDDVYFVADQRGYEAVVYYLYSQFLKTDRSGKIVDPRLQLNKVAHACILLLCYIVYIYSIYKPEQSTCMCRWCERSAIPRVASP